MNKFLTRSTLSALLAASFVTACGGDDEHEEGLAAEFCEHAESGPFQTVTAAATATDGPAASFEHTSVTVTLTDYMGQKGGCVHLDIAEAAEFALAVSDGAVSMAVTDAQGAAVAAEKTETIDECTELARMDTFDFEVGRYDVCFGPTALTELKFGMEEAAHEGEHNHE